MADQRLRLRGDCANCVGLCCVALPFSASVDFAIDKAAGEPCPNLQEDFRCRIHDRLRPKGFPGCTAYDCFGAGQQVSQVTFHERDWRQDERMVRVFPIMRQLHELLWYLNEALGIPAAAASHPELRRALAYTESLTRGGPETLVALDLTVHRRDVAMLLRSVSDHVRPPRAAWSGRIGPGADLAGADLRRADLRGADLHNAYLIAADLRGADLRLADLLGADIRNADLRGADLSGGLFLTQPQLDAARGDARTRLSSPLTRPSHWS